MREMPHGGGMTAVYADIDTSDALFIEPVMTEFVPMNGSLRCVCGATIKAWSWRQVAPDRVEFICTHCHCVRGIVRLATRARR